MLQLHKLTNRTLWRISQLQRDPFLEPQPWADEVEQIVFGGAAATHLGDSGSAFLVADDDGRMVGAALHYEHEQLPYVQYIAAIFVDPRYRQRRLERAMLRLVVVDARQRSGRPYVAWVVHPGNAAMLSISRELVREFGTDTSTGYVQFVHPDS
jgi:ribosomal protein S18 acetylase RimI-like enzyme